MNNTNNKKGEKTGRLYKLDRARCQCALSINLCVLHSDRSLYHALVYTPANLNLGLILHILHICSYITKHKNLYYILHNDVSFELRRRVNPRLRVRPMNQEIIGIIKYLQIKPFRRISWYGHMPRVA